MGRIANMPQGVRRRGDDDSTWDWKRRAECRKHDPDTFFPRSGGRDAARDAKRICIKCPVRSECLEHAMKYDERLGVWGGLAEIEREQLRARRAGRRPRGGKGYKMSDTPHDEKLEPEFYEDKSGEFRWRVRDLNGEIVDASSEGFTTMPAARENYSQNH